MLLHPKLQLLGLMTLLAGCASAPPPLAAPASGSLATPSAPGRGFGVLIMAHGGTPAWNAAVLDAVQPLRERYDLEVAFGMADATSLQDAVTKLEARDARTIGVVRLFVSGESFLAETEQIFGLRPGAPPAPTPAGSAVPADPAAHAGHAGSGAHAGPAGPAAHAGHAMAFHRVATRAAFSLSSHGLADAGGMATILADRAAALSKNPAKEDVLILAHGPGDDAENARWLAKLDERAAAVRARAPFRRVQIETLREDWPDKRVAAEARVRGFVKRATDDGGTAIVIPFRVQGFGPYAKVLEGLDYVADQQGLIPHPEVTTWIEHEIQALQAGPFRATLPAEAPASAH